MFRILADSVTTTHQPSLEYQAMLRLALLVVACATTACSRAPQSQDPEEARGAPYAEASATAAVPAPTSDPTAISSMDSFEDDFSGSAFAFMRGRSQPATPELRNDMQQLIRKTAKLEGCIAHAGHNQVHLVDLDADGVAEGLSLYSLESCGGGNLVRILTVMRRDGNANWVPVLETAISTKRGSERRIIELGDGKITLAGGDDGFGGTQDHEVIPVPPANSEQQQRQ